MEKHEDEPSIPKLNLMICKGKEDVTIKVSHSRHQGLLTTSVPLADRPSPPGASCYISTPRRYTLTTRGFSLHQYPWQIDLLKHGTFGCCVNQYYSLRFTGLAYGYLTLIGSGPVVTGRTGGDDHFKGTL